MNDAIDKYKKELLYLACFSLPIIYFIIQQQVPWERLAPKTWTISISYLFDICFFALVIYIYKYKNLIGKTNVYTLGIRLLTVILFAVISIIITNQSPTILAPFRYLDHLFIQVLILAPIIEEMIFRGCFYTVFEKAGVKATYNIVINSALFSFSHYFALNILPENFHSFIYLQLVYTFFLGWLCSKSRQRTGGILEPIILHFAFNLVFYMAIRMNFI